MSETSNPSLLSRRQQWLEQVDFALRTYGLAPAARLADQALAEGVEDAVLLNLAASIRYGDGRFDEALQLLRRADALAPGDPNVLNSLGVCQFALGQTDAALQSYDAALQLDPRMAPAHFNRGAVLEQIDDIKGARAAYEQAAALDRNYLEPLASLAWLDALSGDAKSARAHADRALALSPANVLARMALASADLQRPDFSAAAARLSALIGDPSLTRLNRAIVAGLIGDLNDAEGSPSEAFAAYQACNAELRAMSAERFERPGVETALARVRRLTAWFEAAEPAAWSDAPPTRLHASEPKAHIFLVGFPRSGTTLLENVLAAHPEVISLEEKDCLAVAEREYLSSDQGLERLARIAPDEAARHRDLYWATVRSFGVEPGGRVFIDKLPLASVTLPVIAKLFPDARVLFALRDPRDVVLSCFRRRFALNAAMYELLSLPAAATYYDAVMRLSERYRDILPLPQHAVRYESLVDDFEGSARAACDFIGLEWDKVLFDFAAKARTRGIATPSAAQVTRGLNREGQGVWRRYRAQMAPVLPMLEPWVRRFGYEPG